MKPIYLLILSSLLLFQSPRSIHAIALSRLCGKFGHSCYGANWGKREVLENFSSDLKKTENDMAIDSNYILNELRLELFRQRLRQLFELEQ